MEYRLYMGVIAASLAPTALSAGFCTSYCDRLGIFNDGFSCLLAPDEYCCGGQYDRYCCRDPDQDISGIYKAVVSCKRSSWIHNWKVLLGILGALLLLLLLIALCCRFCSFCKKLRAPLTPVRRQTISATADTAVPQTVGEGRSDTTIPGQNVNPFNPDTPFAFQPPAYESLEKEPPKYADICVVSDAGQTNDCYVNDDTDPTTSSAANPAGQSDIFEEIPLDDPPHDAPRSRADSTTSLPTYDLALTRDRVATYSVDSVDIPCGNISTIHLNQPGNNTQPQTMDGASF